MPEMKKNNKLKQFIPVILGVGIVVSLGINAYLYNQLTHNDKDILGIQAKQASIKKEYNILSLKIEDSQKSLSDIQEKK